MRLPRPSYVLIVIVGVFAYTGALFPALVVLGFFLWMFGPAIIVSSIARDVREIAKGINRR